MNEELWKDIEGYEGLYQISVFGDVKSLPKRVFSGSVYYWSKERILKPIRLGNYLGVQLCKNGEHKKHYIHRLVAKAFIPNPLNKKEVNHIDGNRYNNNVKNLEWVTRKENEIHAIRTGLKNSTGENNPMCKFPNDLIRKIRDLYDTGRYSQAELARKFGVSHMQVNRIVRGLLRKDVI